MKTIKTAAIVAICFECILASLFFTLGHVQASSHDYSNPIGLLVFYLHFPGMYLLRASHHFLDAHTAIPYLSTLFCFTAAQWFLLALVYITISKRLRGNNAA